MKNRKPVRELVSCLVTVVFVAWRLPDVTAQGIQRDGRRELEAAQTKVMELRQAWRRAEQELTRAQSAYQTASNQVQQVRQAAIQQHSAKLGLTAAFRERDTTWRQLQKRHNAIEAELKADGAYQTVSQQADEARQRLSESAGNNSLDPERRKNLAADLNAKIRRPAELRKAAEAKDAEMQQILDHWRTVDRKVADLQRQVKATLEADPETITAIERANQRGAELEKARKNWAQAQQDFNSAQVNFNRQREAWQRAMAQNAWWRAGRWMYAQ